MVPWDSGEGFAPTTAPGTPDAATRPSAGPVIGGPRPSSPAVQAEPETNPRAVAPGQADSETNPRRAAGPHDTDESSEPRPRASAPRPLGAEDEHAPTRAGGPRALSRSDVKASAARPADSDADVAKTTAAEVPDDTNPRAMPRPRANLPRPADSDADLGATAATEVIDPTNPRARAPQRD